MARTCCALAARPAQRGVGIGDGCVVCVARVGMFRSRGLRMCGEVQPCGPAQTQAAGRKASGACSSAAMRDFVKLIQTVLGKAARANRSGAHNALSGGRFRQMRWSRDAQYALRFGGEEANAELVILRSGDRMIVPTPKSLD